jgi:response regulator of citrate/malate metabolism
MILKEFNRKDISVSNKDKHVLTFWFEHASVCIGSLGREVTAGEVGRHVGQTTVTARKYLNRLVSEGALISHRVVFKNGTEGVVYGHIE